MKEHLYFSLWKKKGVIILNTERKSIPLNMIDYEKEKTKDNWWLSSKNIRLTWSKAKVLKRDSFPLNTIDYVVVTIYLYYFEFQVLWTFCPYLILQILFIWYQYSKPLAPQSSTLKWLAVLFLLFPNMFYILFFLLNTLCFLKTKTSFITIV